MDGWVRRDDVVGGKEADAKGWRVGELGGGYG